jgi:ABC-type arginine transport system ATPase subunit
MVFQTYALYPHMTVEQNLGFPLRMAKVAAAEKARRVRAAAEILDITATCSAGIRVSCRADSASALRWAAQSSVRRACS